MGWKTTAAAAAGQQRVKGEVEVQRDGQTYHYYNIITPIQKGDRFYGILGTNIDITERKRAQNALQEANDGLEVRVHQRTAELAVINEQLQCEVEERRRARNRPPGRPSKTHHHPGQHHRRFHFPRSTMAGHLPEPGRRAARWKSAPRKCWARWCGKSFPKRPG